MLPVASLLHGMAATLGGGLGGEGLRWCCEQEVGVMAGAGCCSWESVPHTHTLHRMW